MTNFDKQVIEKEVKYQMWVGALTSYYMQVNDEMSEEELGNKLGISKKEVEEILRSTHPLPLKILVKLEMVIGQKLIVF